VRVEDFLCFSRFDYDYASVELYAYRCRWVSGELRKYAHQALQWVLPSDLRKVDLAAADRPIAERLFVGQPF